MDADEDCSFFVLGIVVVGDCNDCCIDSKVSCPCSCVTVFTVEPCTCTVLR